MAGGFAYTAMQAAYTGQRREISPLFAWGGLLLEDPSPAAQAYLARAGPTWWGSGWQACARPAGRRPSWRGSSPSMNN